MLLALFLVPTATAWGGGSRGAHIATIVSELWAYLDHESESQATVTLSTADEVPGPRPSELDHRFTLVIRADWVYGVTEFVIQSVHFQDVVDRRIGEHCSHKKSIS